MTGIKELESLSKQAIENKQNLASVTCFPTDYIGILLKKNSDQDKQFLNTGRCISCLKNSEVFQDNELQSQFLRMKVCFIIFCTVQTL